VGPFGLEVEVEINDELFFVKITILSELSESNTQKIANFKVLYLAQKW